jgi:peptidyl-prolyl cis-trans isomerase SurA
VLAVLWAPPVSLTRAEVVEEIVARVNDDIITLTQLRERESRVVSELFSRYSGEELERKIREARGGLLRDMVRESMLLQRADTLGLDTQKIVDVGLEQIKRQNDIKTNEELLRTLREQGTTLEELREQILRYNVPPILLDREVRQKVSVNDKEIEAYYNDHREEFLIPETVTFREIVLKLGEGTDAEAQRAKAAAALAELEGGAPFEALVEKYSEAPSRDVGGRVGPLGPGELARQIERALRDLAPGGTSPAVESRYGLHILRLEERVEQRQRDLAEVRSEIEDKLREEKSGTAIEAYFEKLSKENFIEISAAYRDIEIR